jgi:hypothetical protein
MSMYNTRKFNAQNTQRPVVSHVRMDWAPVVAAIAFVAIVVLAIIVL